jgi:hypothetical protein
VWELLSQDAGMRGTERVIAFSQLAVKGLTRLCCAFVVLLFFILMAFIAHQRLKVLCTVDNISNFFVMGIMFINVTVRRRSIDL